MFKADYFYSVEYRTHTVPFEIYGIFSSNTRDKRLVLEELEASICKSEVHEIADYKLLAFNKL